MRIRAHENARTCTRTAVAKSQHTRQTVTATVPAKKACIVVKEKLVIVRGERAGMQLSLRVFDK